MARKKELRFLAPAGLRRAQYEKFFDVVSEIAPEIWSDFWAECWPQVRDCEHGREYIHARKAADAWLRRMRLTGPDGAPPAWLLDNLEMALATRAQMARNGGDPGEQFFGIAAVGMVDSAEFLQVFPPVIPMEFRFLLEPHRGLEAEKKRISEQFSDWLDGRIAELAERGGKEALNEEMETQAVKAWLAEWLRRTQGRTVKVEFRAERTTQALIQRAGELLGLALPERRGRPRKSAKN